MRPLQLADAEQVQVLFPKWEIVRYLTAQVPWPYPPDGAYQFYRNVALPAMERGNAWHWMLALKTAPSQVIGSIGLMNNNEVNRGFWLGLPWQGQGLMTEACAAITDYWFNALKFPVLRVPKAVANTASRRISEKEGMRVLPWNNATTFVDGFLRKYRKLLRKSGVRANLHPANRIRVLEGTR